MARPSLLRCVNRSSLGPSQRRNACAKTSARCLLRPRSSGTAAHWTSNGGRRRSERGVARIEPERPPAHLGDGHRGRGCAEINQAVDAGGIPSLSEERPSTDEHLRDAVGEDARRELDPESRLPGTARRRQPREATLVGFRPPVREVCRPCPRNASRSAGLSRSAQRNPRPDTSSGRSDPVRPSALSARSASGAVPASGRNTDARAASGTAEARSASVRTRARSASPRASYSQPTTSTSATDFAAELVSRRSTSEAPRRMPCRVSVNPSSRNAAPIAS
jgi:hypothetical protein